MEEFHYRLHHLQGISYKQVNCVCKTWVEGLFQDCNCLSYVICIVTNTANHFVFHVPLLSHSFASLSSSSAKFSEVNQSIFICVALFIQKVAQSATQILKTTTEIKNNKGNQEKKIRSTQLSHPNIYAQRDTYTLMLLQVFTHTDPHTHTHTYTSCH